MRKHYTSPEVEAFLLNAEECIAAQGGVTPLNDDSLDGETGVSSSIFG